MNYFLFSVHRGGSCVLGDVAKFSFELDGVPVNILGESFPELGENGAARKVESTVGECYAPNLERWEEREGAFVPIRRADFFPVQLMGANDIGILNIRDPRDCMVSGYYGFLLRHQGGLGNASNKKNYNKGLDRYALEEMLSKYKTIFQAYIDLVERIPDVKILKYETMVTDFDSWLLSFYDSAGLKKSNYATALSHCRTFFDEVEIECEYNHKRQMLPGDHYRKLNEGTIAILNRELSEILSFFGYSWSFVVFSRS